VSATGRLEDARSILLQWAGVVSEGMLPNRFSDRDGVPEFNSVDAPLWYIVAVHDFLATSETNGVEVARADRASLAAAIEAILDGYSRGTRYGIHMTTMVSSRPELRVSSSRGGRQGRRPSDHAAHRQAGRDPSSVAQRLAHRRELFRAAGVSSTCAGNARSKRASGTPSQNCLFDVVDEFTNAAAMTRRSGPIKSFAVGGLPHALIRGQARTRYRRSRRGAPS